MQTFLPYPDYHQTAEVLDSSRLGNQCYNETFCLLNGKWPHHPASKMWLQYDCQYSLCQYGIALAMELYRRGNIDTGVKWFGYYFDQSKKYRNPRSPPWLGNPDFHAAHRSNLLRKDFKYYSQFGWTEPDDLPYIWPIIK